jgi:integrase
MAKKRGNSEGSIYQRHGDGRWAAALTLSNGRRRTLYGRTRADVDQKLLQARTANSESSPSAKKKLRLDAFLNTWLDETAAIKVRPRTLERYRQIVRLHLIPSIGDRRVVDLTKADVQRMIRDGTKKGLSPQTVAHHRAVLRGALNAAVDDDIITRNVATKADLPRVQNLEVSALTSTAAKQLLDAVAGDRLEALITVALTLGLRQGEALGLRWTDIDIEGGTIRVRRSLQRINREWLFLEPKTKGSSRTIAAPVELISALRVHRARQLEERLKLGQDWKGDVWGDLVFPDHFGSPLSGFHVSRRFKTLLGAAGLPPMRYHDLRHGAASLMAALGISPRVAMEILGHAQISTTMNIYTHVAPELQREAADRLGSALWATG